MSDREGVIKYELEHSEGPAPMEEEVAAVRGWREVLHDLNLIAQDPERYEGVGFGNISCRADGTAFWISGTQTGGFKRLDLSHYTKVEMFSAAENRLKSRGPIRPSSESMTHGTLYGLQPEMGVVMHVHSPEIWRRAGELSIPATERSVPYGTPQMALEVERLFQETPVGEKGIFVMLGHEDGVVSFGPTADAAGEVLMRNLAAALA